MIAFGKKFSPFVFFLKQTYPPPPPPPCRRAELSPPRPKRLATLPPHSMACNEVCGFDNADYEHRCKNNIAAYAANGCYNSTDFPGVMALSIGNGICNDGENNCI